MAHAWMLGLAAWAAMAIPGSSQESKAWLANEPIPSPPASMVADRAELLARKPEQARRISDKLLKLRRDIGFELYLVIQSGLESDGPDVTAAVLQDPWVPKRNGLVVVFETDSRKVGFGRPFLTDSNQIGLVPSFDTVSVIAKATGSIDRNLPDEQLLEELIDRLSDGFRESVRAADEPVPAGRSLRLGLFAIGTASALALGVLIVGWLVKRGNDSKSRRYGFTEIDRPERLGAPFGGGVVSTRRFRN